MSRFEAVFSEILAKESQAKNIAEKARREENDRKLRERVRAGTNAELADRLKLKEAARKELADRKIKPVSCIDYVFNENVLPLARPTLAGATGKRHIFMGRLEREEGEVLYIEGAIRRGEEPYRIEAKMQRDGLRVSGLSLHTGAEVAIVGDYTSDSSYEAANRRRFLLVRADAVCVENLPEFVMQNSRMERLLKLSEE